MALILFVSLFAFALSSDRTEPEHRACFLTAYPGVICDIDAGHVILCDGQRVLWAAEHAGKTYEARLNSAAPQDMVSQRYPPGLEFDIPEVGVDPGRLRSEALLKAMYGDSRAAVREKTTTIAWMPKSGGKRLRVTTVNGVADALQRVSDDLERELSPAHRQIAAKSSGLFVWRKVRGKDRLSPHSFATAIDIGVSVSDYWDWNKPDKDGRYRWKNRFPLPIVEIFERHGFIWGGKWYHFDTMHFEYRPELLVAPCVDGASPLRTLGGQPFPG